MGKEHVFLYAGLRWAGVYRGGLCDQSTQGRKRGGIGETMGKQKIKPKYLRDNSFWARLLAPPNIHYPNARKRDGNWSGYSDDNQYWMWATRKYACFSCHKVWRRNHRHIQTDIAKCPQCGGSVKRVNSMAQVPRASNKRGWKVAERLYTKWASKR